jgi:carlactone synthase/all-trans-10'-apo-beta-carotenal 13,14-cleaving dioxygenase
MPSIGQFEMGDRRFVGFLDCYGKMHRFDIRGDTVCATYRMMESAFYNESKQTGTIGAGLLFFETEPPRETPWYLGPVANMPPFAPNDNTFVNTIRLGDELLSLTDSYAMLAVDPKTMRVKREKEFKDDLKGLVCYTGSAHPLRDAKTGDWIDFVGNVKNMLSGTTTLRLYRLGEQQPDFRRSITDLDFESSPYMHSFGLTENFVVLPRMPVKFSATEVAIKPMAAAFEEVDLTEEGPENAFHIAPLDGSKAWIKQLPTDQPLWYVHTANAFEREGEIVIDLTTCPQNPFSADLTLAASRDKGTRDLGAVGGKNLVKRFVIPLSDDQPVRSEVISDPDTSTDFPCINPGFRAKEHCFYWAVEWFATSDSYADMAIVKHDICGGEKKLTWRRENWYPSEATMVPSDRAGAAEDEGVLIFTALEGATGNSYLLGVDAQTMELVSEAGPFPRIPFSTHGQFYPAGAKAAAGIGVAETAVGEGAA